MPGPQQKKKLDYFMFCWQSLQIYLLSARSIMQKALTKDGDCQSKKAIKNILILKEDYYAT